MVLTGQKGFVSGVVHEGVAFGFVADFQLEQPAVGVRAGVDDAGILRQPLVDFDDDARNRRVNLAGGFDALEGAAFLLGLQLGVDFRKLSVDDIAESFLGVVGDADDADAVRDDDPLVFLAETPLGPGGGGSGETTPQRRRRGGEIGGGCGVESHERRGGVRPRRES